MYLIAITFEVIMITVAITFVFRHPQKECKTHLNGLMLYFSGNVRYEQMQ